MEVLTIGPIHDIDDEVIRALPARATVLFPTLVAATTINISNASDMSDPVAFTSSAFTNGGVQVAAGFIQVVGGQALLRLAAE